MSSNELAWFVSGMGAGGLVVTAYFAVVLYRQHRKRRRDTDSRRWRKAQDSGATRSNGQEAAELLADRPRARMRNARYRTSGRRSTRS